MSSEKCYNHAGYQQGFDDGKRTGGKINKKYLENLFKIETQNLSNQESIQYKLGWQDGFADAVRGLIKGMVMQENCIKNHLDKLYNI